METKTRCSGELTEVKEQWMEEKCKEIGTTVSISLPMKSDESVDPIVHPFDEKKGLSNRPVGRMAERVTEIKEEWLEDVVLKVENKEECSKNDHQSSQTCTEKEPPNGISKIKGDIADTTSAASSEEARNVKRVHKRARPYGCDICDFETFSNVTLRRHKLTHGEKQRLECPQCDFTCLETSELKKHKAVHAKYKPLACDVCDFRCSRAFHLKTHLLIHTNKKPFACDTCDFRCNQAASLKRHKMIHTGEKPFACKTCDYKCNRASHLRNHELRHIEEAAFACGI